MAKLLRRAKKWEPPKHLWMNEWVNGMRRAHAVEGVLLWLQEEKVLAYARLNLENSVLGAMSQSQEDRSRLSEVPSAVQSTETGGREVVGGRGGWGE